MHRDNEELTSFVTVETYRLEKWSDDSVGIPTRSNIITDDYDKMKEYYLNDLMIRGNQRVHEKDVIDLFASFLHTLTLEGKLVS